MQCSNTYGHSCTTSCAIISRTVCTDKQAHASKYKNPLMPHLGMHMVRSLCLLMFEGMKQVMCVLIMKLMYYWKVHIDSWRYVVLRGISNTLVTISCPWYPEIYDTESWISQWKDNKNCWISSHIYIRSILEFVRSKFEGQYQLTWFSVSENNSVHNCTCSFEDFLLMSILMIWCVW